jgi:hypothetical protein
MRRGRVAVVVTFAVACAVGCGLTLTGTEPVGGTNGGDASALDRAAGDDGSVSGDGASGDAIGDAASDVLPDALPDGGCSTLGAHAFCDDFDDGTFGAKWSSNLCAGSTDQAVSLPGSAKCVMAAGVDAPMGRDHAVAPNSRTHLEVDIHLDQSTITGSDELEIARVEAVDGSNVDIGGVRVMIDKDSMWASLCTTASACSSRPAITTTIPVGWHHLLADVTLANGSGSYDVTLGSAHVQEMDLGTKGSGTVATIRTMIGPTAAGNTLNTTVYYDNATIDWY